MRTSRSEKRGLERRKKGNRKERIIITHVLLLECTYIILHIYSLYSKAEKNRYFLYHRKVQKEE